MAVTQSGYAISTYRDPKRYGWLLSFIVPAIIWSGPLLYMRTGSAAWLWFPVAFFYVGLPVIDLVVGRNTTNPPESAFRQLEADYYYRVVAWIMVPFLWATFIGMVWFATTQRLPWWAVIPVLMGTGSAGGFCINVGHELGHKHEGIERVLTKIVLAPTCYGHFTTDHNRGHHSDVSTPEDCASARMGESIYRFAMREVPGAWRRSWRLERERLLRKGVSAWTWQNEILQPLAITVTLWAAIIVWLGWKVLPILVASSFWANFQLTSANYIEHYGLLRSKIANGRYEPCQPQHSWNSDHTFSNYALLHLQRHSDHHAWPTRPYQTLRTFPELPQLPNGYFGMFLLSYFPWLWFRLMDPVLLKAVGRNPERINFQPGRRQKLVRKYALASQ